MKKTFLLTLAVAPMILGAPLASMAESVTTDPVGFVKSPVAVNSFTLVGVNLLKPAVYAAGVESTTSNSITVTHADADIAAVLGSGSYYVEVTSGGSEGDRIDVASASGNTITLNTGASHNTLGDASSISAGSTIIIREHLTFAGLAAGLDNLVPGNESSSADRILTFEGGGFVTHFYAPDENWYTDDGEFTVVNDKVIPPASGVLFYAHQSGDRSGLELMTLGEVRTNDVVRPMVPGFQIVSTGFPMDLSPSDLVWTDEFFTAGNDSSSADLILTFDGAFITYFLAPDNNWYSDDGEFTVVTGAELLGAQGATLVYRNTADPDFRIANQYTP
jgi:uncharacterized protein (TIGR02597 family)